MFWTLRPKNESVRSLLIRRSMPSARSLTYGPTEIIIQRVKKWSPEQIAQHLLLFDPDLCTELFLSELKRVLPTPDQVRLDAIISYHS